MSLKTDKLLEQVHHDEEHSSFSSAEKTFAGKAAAAQAFAALKEKLLNINEWNAHAMLTTFRLFDENGRPAASEKLSRGIFLRIDLKGSGKYDWVRVVEIDEAADEFIITVKPTFD